MSNEFIIIFSCTYENEYKNTHIWCNFTRKTTNLLFTSVYWSSTEKNSWLKHFLLKNISQFFMHQLLRISVNGNKNNNSNVINIHTKNIQFWKNVLLLLAYVHIISWVKYYIKLWQQIFKMFILNKNSLIANILTL